MQQPFAPDYKNCGGRGITVCAEWDNSFEAYYNYVGEPPTPQHTLDRIDNDGHYEPANVRWAIQKEQGRNKRSNRLLNIGGVSMTMKDAAERYGVKYNTLCNRICTLG